MLTFYTLYRAGLIFLRVVETAIFVYCIWSWLRPTNRIFYGLRAFISPFVAPFRRFSAWLMSKTNMPLDFSCWFAMIGLELIGQLWTWLFSRIL